MRCYGRGFTRRRLNDTNDAERADSDDNGIERNDIEDINKLRRGNTWLKAPPKAEDRYKKEKKGFPNIFQAVALKDEYGEERQWTDSSGMEDNDIGAMELRHEALYPTLSISMSGIGGLRRRGDFQMNSQLSFSRMSRVNSGGNAIPITWSMILSPRGDARER